VYNTESCSGVYNCVDYVSGECYLDQATSPITSMRYTVGASSTVTASMAFLGLAAFAGVMLA
jgi:hypothetical protein